jgi:ATP-dependent protease ClpP protease subunit
MLECRVAFNDSKELMIYDIIMPFKHSPDDPSITPDQVLNFMKDAPEELTVRINSAGGEVGAALAIYNRLMEHKGVVNTIVDGYAFSSAGWLALAGTNRQICNGGLFMMHNPYLYERIDSLAKLDAVKNRWETHRNSIIDIFTTRTPMKAEEVQNLMEVETYMSASESVDRGLFHSVRNGKSDTAILNCLHIPEAAMNKADVPRPDLTAIRLKALNLKKKYLTTH